jgi:ubiquinone/menaquinone biosynthesis C-methylase UbiE
VSVAERYDRASEDYGRYWAPVLDVAARGTVDAAADAVEAALARSAATSDAPRATLVDVGTGAGVLVIDAWRRWGARGLRVVGTDASRGMLDAARRQAAAAGIPDAALEWLHGDAAHLPLPDAAADVIVSSFVYQLVPDRHAAFREARRVLRPRGVLALTTWLDVETPFAPADEFDEAVLDLDIEEDDDPRDDEVVAGDFESVKAAAAQLRRAGFHAVDAREVTLEYRWDLERYLEYKRSYGEQALFGELDEDVAEALMRRARERLAQLTPDAFVWRTPVVLAVATRP